MTGFIRHPTTGTPVFLPIDSPTLAQPPSRYGDWQWSLEHGGYRPVERRFFELHPIEEGDSRFHQIACGERVSVNGPTFRLWMPEFIAAERLRHRGLVAVSLAGGSPWKQGTPDLWLAGEPLAFLRRLEDSVYDWVRRCADDSTTWFTYEGASLWQLMSIGRYPGDERLVVDVERAV
ncbi:MAG TPA: hypothetical protein VGM90_25430 [Kofleriaceae bacterium]|jgi:hypothetical protein